ncbi:MAG: hypothetical protein U0441_18925 [Polyangiaceae bacterium]
MATGGGGFNCAVPSAPRKTPTWPMLAFGTLAGLAAKFARPSSQRFLL